MDNLAFSQEYTVKLTRWDEGEVPKTDNAKYDSLTKRLVWTAPADKDSLYMADIKTIEFTAKA